MDSRISEHMESISITPNQKVDIKIEGNPDIKLIYRNGKGVEKEIEQDANQIIVPSSKGKYIYRLVSLK